MAFLPLTRWPSWPLSPLWSLGVEEQFYLLWPLALILLLRRPRHQAAWMTFAAIVLLSIWGAALDLRGATASRLQYAPDTRMQAILIGCLLAFFYASPLRAQLVKWSRRALLPGVILMVWLIAGYARVGVVWPLHQGSLQAFDLAAAALLIGAVEGFPSLRLLSFRPLVWLGVISYSLYLWHRPIAGLYGVLPTDHYANMPLKLLALTVAIGVSAMSYYFVERRFIRRQPKLVVRPAEATA